VETFSTADGLKLAYRRAGSGPTVVCHPGGPGFSARYFGEFAGLADDFTLVMLHPRGTEGSDRPSDPRAYTSEDYVADLDELRVHLGHEQFRLLGHSHGGVVALAYAARNPDRVERLVAASTLARFDAEQEGVMLEAMEAKSDEPWYADARAALEAEQAGNWDSDEELAELALREFPFYFARYGEAEAEYVRRLEGEVPCGDALRLFNQEIVGSFDLRPELGRITAPTLVITGEDDFITGPVCARELAAEIPGARLTLLPDCGHFVFVEQPESFAAEVKAFL
jgi:proline-specific peptidase